MSVNPFEPPRSGDTGDPAFAGGMADVLPEDAFRELVASAPWARWTARLGLASGVLTVVQSVVSLRQATKPQEVFSTAAGLIMAIPMLVIWVVLARRYADDAERLGNREPRALAGVIYTQRTLFKTLVILSIIGGVLGMLVAIVGAVAGSKAAGS